MAGISSEGHRECMNHSERPGSRTEGTMGVSRERIGVSRVNVYSQPGEGV